jgi:hypothetical protein
LRSDTPFSTYIYYRKNYPRHWTSFLATIPGTSILAALEQLSHFPDRGLSNHLFSFLQAFLYLFDQDSHYMPIQVMDVLISCVESLALALECDPAPGWWLVSSFSSFGLFSVVSRHSLQCSGIQHKHATTLQHNVKRVETAFRAKVLCVFFAFQHSL